MTRKPCFASGQSVGLFGGSFDPPHAGHRLVSLTALKALELDYIWWLVSPQNPLKKHPPSNMHERLAACRMVARHRKIHVSDEETRRSTHYAIDTVRHLKAAHPGVRFIWIMGADNLADLHNWKFWNEFMQELPVAVYPRPGYTLRAGGSPAATRFAPWRKPALSARQLKFNTSPAWILLDGVLSGLASSALRHQS